MLHHSHNILHFKVPPHPSNVVVSLPKPWSLKGGIESKAGFKSRLSGYSHHTATYVEDKVKLGGTKYQ